MDDEFDRSDIDERIRRAVHADPAAARRAAAAALNAHALPRRGRAGRRRLLIVAVVAVGIGASVVGWRGRSVSRRSAGSLSIRGSGSTVVVDGERGQRWIVIRRDQERPHGGYVIVLPQ